MSTFAQAIHQIKSFPRKFWILMLATLVNQLGNMAFFFLVVYATAYLHFSLPTASALFSLVAISMLLSGLIAGYFIDTLGALRVMSAAVLLNGVSLIIFSQVQTFSWIVILCILWGISYGMYRPASQTMVTTLRGDVNQKLAFTIFRLVLNLGLSLGPALGGILITYNDYNLLFILNGCANLSAFLILLIGFKGHLKQGDVTVHAIKNDFTLKLLWTDKRLSLFLLAALPVTMVFYQHETTLPYFIKHTLSLPLSLYGFLFTINTIMIVFCELPLNILMMNCSNRLNFVLGALFITVGFASFYFASTGLHIILITCIWTIGEMLLFPSANAYIAELAPPEKRGRYMALFSTFFNVALFGGPWLGSVVAAYLGAHQLWLVCGVFGMLSVLMLSITNVEILNRDQ